MTKIAPFPSDDSDEVPKALRHPDPVLVTVQGDVPMYDVLSHLVAAGYVVHWSRDTGIVIARRPEDA